MALQKQSHKTKSLPLPAPLSDEGMVPAQGSSSRRVRSPICKIESDEIPEVHTQVSATEPIPEPFIKVEDEQEDDSANPYMDFELESFLDDQRPPQERLDLFQAFEASLKAHRKAWVNKGSPPCSKCGGSHPEPCLTHEGLTQSKHLRESTRKLKREVHATAAPQPNKAASQVSRLKARPRLKPCQNCARWHKGGHLECHAPDCVKCGLAHYDTESCTQSRQRFQEAGLKIPAEVPRDEEEQKKKPAPSKAKAPKVLDDDEVRHYSTLLGAIGNDAAGITAMAQLLSHTAGKRKAEESLPAPSKAKRVSRSKSPDSALKPLKGPFKDDGKGKGVRALNNSIWSLRD